MRDLNVSEPIRIMGVLKPANLLFVGFPTGLYAKSVMKVYNELGAMKRCNELGAMKRCTNSVMKRCNVKCNELMKM